MVRIYIRHGEKAYRNGHNETLKHDPPITDNGRVEAFRVAQLLIQKYGPPVLIMTSPYRRTRETAMVMREAVLAVAATKTEAEKSEGNSVVPSISYIPEIRCDNYIAEYLGNHNETDVTDETALHLPPSHKENLNSFHRRIKDHLQLAAAMDNFPHPVWFITHCFVISTITKLMGPKYVKNFSPLGCIEIQKHVTEQGQKKKVKLQALPIPLGSSWENRVGSEQKDVAM